MTENGTEKELLPDVRVYIDAVQQATQSLHSTHQALSAMYPDRDEQGTSEQYAQYEAFWTQKDEYTDRFIAACTTAWLALVDSRNPLIAWVGRNCSSSPAEARILLAALPASLRELDQLAKEEEWGLYWGIMRSQMAEAGVLPA